MEKPVRQVSIIIVGLVTAVFCATAQGRLVFVPGEFTNLQEAVDSLATGDTIYVTAPYLSGYGNRDVTADGKGIVFQSGLGAAGVTIDCQGTPGDEHRAFIFDSGEDSLTVIDGFRIVNGYADTGGAIYINRTTPTIRNSVFENNYASLGGAIGGYQGAPTIDSCTFINNEAYRGGAIDGLGRPVIRASRFTGNHAASRGGAVSDVHGAIVTDCIFDENTGGGAVFDLIGGSARLQRCVFARNESGGLSVVYGYQSMQVERCTFYGNAYGMQALGDTYVVPRNTMIVFNRGDAAFCSITDSVTILLNYCNVYGNVRNYFGCIAENLGQDGNISADPMFCDTAAMDLTLQSSSACATGGAGGVPIGAYGVGCTPTSIVDDPSGLPQAFELQQNFPNPFNPATTIGFSVPIRTHVSIAVYNILGERVAVLFDQTAPAGSYEVTWDGTAAASGVYFYRLTAGDIVDTRKMLLLK